MLQNQTTQVCPDTFKQLILDVVTKSQKMMMPEVRDALMTILSCYTIGPIWTDMATGKPSGQTEWYWIKVKQERKFASIMPAKRVNGGFLCGLLPNQPDSGRLNKVYMIPDLSVEQYAPIFMPH